VPNRDHLVRSLDRAETVCLDPEPAALAEGTEAMGRWQKASLCAGLLLAVSVPAGGQVSLGGHLARTPEPFGVSRGIGARLEFGAPLIPLFVAVSGEYFFTGCAMGDCDLRGVSVDANYAITIPLLRPWVGVGWSVRQSEEGGRKRTERGVNVGIGGALMLSSFHPFVDVRYRPSKILSGRPLVLRLGVMLR
jgi:hypothetical protein